MPDAAVADNPLLVADGLPRFDRIEPATSFRPCAQSLPTQRRGSAQIERDAGPTWASAVEALDELNTPFQYSWGPVSHLLGVKNSPELRKASEEVLPEVVSFSLRVSQSESIYRASKALREGAAWSSLSEAQRRIVDQKILDAELSGIGLSGEARERFNAIVQELSQLSTDFSNHVLDATKEFSIVVSEPAEVEGLPPSLLRLASQSYNGTLAEGAQPGTEEAGPWRFTLEFPSYGPFMQHSRRRELREKMYRAYVTRASSGPLDNTPLIQKILALRDEKAKLLGFKTFAELSLAKKMAPSVSSVEEMFETLRRASRSAAEKELDEIRGLAADSGVREQLINWDIAFWSERLRERKFQYTEEELRPYFPLESVLRGIIRSRAASVRCPRDASRRPGARVAQGRSLFPDLGRERPAHRVVLPRSLQSTREQAGRRLDG